MKRITYFGSPALSASVLESLYSNPDVEVALIVTQPDRKAGKSLSLTPTPVKLCAIAHKTEYFDGDIRDPHTHDNLVTKLNKENIDLCILFAYSRMISDTLLAVPKLGFWNIHPSLLPAYRGPSPTVYPIIMGDDKTGVTLIQLVKKMDAGPIVAQNTICIDDQTTRITLENQIIQLARHMLVQCLCADFKINLKSQNEIGVSYTKKIARNDGYISLNFLTSACNGKLHTIDDLPVAISSFIRENHIEHQHSYRSGRVVSALHRALIGWPGIWTTVQIKNQVKRLKIIDCRLSGEGKLIINDVQLEGKNICSFKTFLKSYNINMV